MPSVSRLRPQHGIGVGMTGDSPERLRFEFQCRSLHLSIRKQTTLNSVPLQQSPQLQRKTGGENKESPRTRMAQFRALPEEGRDSSAFSRPVPGGEISEYRPLAEGVSAIDGAIVLKSQVLCLVFPHTHAATHATNGLRPQHDPIFLRFWINTI